VTTGRRRRHFPTGRWRVSAAKRGCYRAKRRVGSVATADHCEAADPLWCDQRDVEGDLTTKRVPEDVYVLQPIVELIQHVLRERALQRLPRPE